MIERHYSLRAAAEATAIDRHTLKVWLTADEAMEWPEVQRGAKFLIPESVLVRLLERRAPHSNFTRRRKLLSALAGLQPSANA